MAKYDYGNNPYDKETQRKDWENYRAEIRAETNLKSGKIASMTAIADAIRNFNKTKGNQ